ncbi:methanogenic corrinoid protein MtbC1 [Prosthecobacter fusiformis]|uniref:Methanogenic corrinoid protein MtbC1 n=1 Tax=Prosthecobacter fusiformis TaxID=48464 RepID=A0A4R7S484_9BACT|nr:MerR family transcriptional regulator [Prosthecobacter fusiformis]TDU73220.1 methanogenic corrinoid protein MtbC1 [Prosthecobacter fusiformis]
MLSTIQAASIRSGLSPHVIRIWERRYEALTPSRTGTNRRMYCDEEIERLKLLRELTENGHRIGNIARLEKAQLEHMLKQSLTRTLSATASFSVDATALLETEEHFVKQCIEATMAYDSDRLRRLLQRARILFGQRCMVHSVICPLIQKVGEFWQAGQIRPSHEHIATAVIREILMTPLPGNQVAPSAPEVVISTPIGEVHELGALLVASSARDLGWRVTYLGPNLPTEEIVACARARKVRAIALSVVYPDRCPVIQEKLRKIRNLMPEKMALIVGGRAATGYAESLTDLKIHWARDLGSLDQLLVQLSSSAAV